MNILRTLTPMQLLLLAVCLATACVCVGHFFSTTWETL